MVPDKTENSGDFQIIRVHGQVDSIDLFASRQKVLDKGNCFVAIIRVMDLGAYLKEIGARPSKWARQQGISPSIISRFLNGKRGLAGETGFRIIEATDGKVTLEELLNQPKKTIR